MKAAEPKTAANHPAGKKEQPFFRKEGSEHGEVGEWKTAFFQPVSEVGAFFGSSPFFSPSLIQRECEVCGEEELQKKENEAGVEEGAISTIQLIAEDSDKVTDGDQGLIQRACEVSEEQLKQLGENTDPSVIDRQVIVQSIEDDTKGKLKVFHYFVLAKEHEFEMDGRHYAPHQLNYQKCVEFEDLYGNKIQFDVFGFSSFTKSGMLLLPQKIDGALHAPGEVMYWIDNVQGHDANGNEFEPFSWVEGNAINAAFLESINSNQNLFFHLNENPEDDIRAAQALLDLMVIKKPEPKIDEESGEGGEVEDKGEGTSKGRTGSSEEAGEKYKFRAPQWLLDLIEMFSELETESGSDFDFEEDFYEPIKNKILAIPKIIVETIWEFYLVVMELMSGAILGDWIENPTILQTLGQILIGFVPIAGQIADVRDLIYNLKKLEESDYKSIAAWFGVILTLVAFIPGVGDVIKAGGKAIFRFLKRNKKVIIEAIEASIDALKYVFKKAREVVDDIIMQLKRKMQDVMERLQKKLDDWMRKNGDELDEGTTPKKKEELKDPDAVVGPNFKKATKEQVEDAQNKLKQYRKDNNLTSKKKMQKNLGFVEGQIGGKSYTLESTIEISRKPKPDDIKIFDADFVKTHVRNTDSEYIMLNKIANDLGATSATQRFPDITGEIKIVSELEYCSSCANVINEFSKMFPNVTIIPIHGIN